MKQRKFASIGWCADDVHIKREDMGLPKWTDEQAEEWLEKHERQIVDDMVDRGWGSIESLMDMSEKGEG